MVILSLFSQNKNLGIEPRIELYLGCPYSHCFLNQVFVSLVLELQGWSYCSSTKEPRGMGISSGCALSKGWRLVLKHSYKDGLCSSSMFSSIASCLVLFADVFGLTQIQTYLKRGNFNWKSESTVLTCRHMCGVFSFVLIDVNGPRQLLVIPLQGRWYWAVWQPS